MLFECILYVQGSSRRPYYVIGVMTQVVGFNKENGSLVSVHSSELAV